MKKKRRFESIDFLRALAIISMVEVHMMIFLPLYTQKQNLLFAALNWFGHLAAPLFLFVIGVSLTISVSRRKKQALSHVLKRGIFIFLAGLLFILIWNPDILHYIGLFIIISYFLLKLNKPLRIATGILAIILAPILLMFIDYNSGWQIIGLKLANLWTLKGFFTNLIINGFYPLLPWIVFPIIGTVVGEYFLTAVKKKKEIEFASITISIGMILTVIGFLIHFLSPIKIDFYPASISYMVLFLGICLLLTGFFFWLLDIKKGFAEYLRPITFMGTVAFSVYVFHVIIGLAFFYFTSTFNTFTLSFAIAYTIILLIFLGLICYLFVRWLGYGPFEYLLRRFS